MLAEACTRRQPKSSKLLKNGKSTEGARGDSNQKSSKGKGKGTSSPNMVENEGKCKGKGKSPAEKQATACSKKVGIRSRNPPTRVANRELRKDVVLAARPEGKARAASGRGRPVAW